jgi:hypothetical protein
MPYDIFKAARGIISEADAVLIIAGAGMSVDSGIKLESWLDVINKNNQKLVILEIGCGINPHSLRMNNGTMLSNEWKLSLGAKRGLKQLLC